jgi:hypothetical protein
VFYKEYELNAEVIGASDFFNETLMILTNIVAYFVEVLLAVNTKSSVIEVAVISAREFRHKVLDSE